MAEQGLPQIRSAGAVLWRPASGERVEVALIHRARYGDWTFPKGKTEPGEHPLLTAVREVAEETGITAVLGRRLPSSRYEVSGQPKRVDYWAARPAASAPGGAVPNDEVDDLVWLPAAAARERLTYPRDVALLDAFTAAPAATVPVILVRHAAARRKDAWRRAGHSSDLARPLTARGEAQARQLAAILACFGPPVLASSAAERCLATLRPYASQAGIRMAAEPALTVGGGDEDGAASGGAAGRLMGALVAAGGPVAVCAHRENLPVLLAAACGALAAPVPSGPPLPKGGLWVLHTAGGRLVSAERHRPTR